MSLSCFCMFFQQEQDGEVGYFLSPPLHIPSFFFENRSKTNGGDTVDARSKGQSVIKKEFQQWFQGRRKLHKSILMCLFKKPLLIHLQTQVIFLILYMMIHFPIALRKRVHFVPKTQLLTTFHMMPSLHHITPFFTSLSSISIP